MLGGVESRADIGADGLPGLFPAVSLAGSHSERDNMLRSSWRIGPVAPGSLAGGANEEKASKSAGGRCPRTLAMAMVAMAMPPFEVDG